MTSSAVGFARLRVIIATTSNTTAPAMTPISNMELFINLASLPVFELGFVATAHQNAVV